MWDNNTIKAIVVRAMKQETFTDIEYSFRKKKTKREKFLEIMDKIIPWDEWVGVIKPYYPTGKRGRPPMGIEKMLRMYLLQIWFSLSDPATEDAIYDSYAMRKFTGIDFMTEAVPDETTLCNFRHLLEAHGLNKLFFDAINRCLVQTGHMMKGGTIVDATKQGTVNRSRVMRKLVCRHRRIQSAGGGDVLAEHLQILHIHVSLAAPLGACRMVQPGADQHEGRVAVRKGPPPGFGGEYPCSAARSHCWFGSSSSAQMESHSR